MKESANSEYVTFVWGWNGRRWELPVSPHDILVWARAIEEEGYPEIGVAWALLQRAAWLKMQGKPVTLAGLVQAYAQPINPEWFPSGAKHMAEIARLERLGDSQGVKAEQAKAALRPAKATKTWAEISDNTKHVVTGILSGQIKSPVTGAVHYWASRGPDFATNQAAKPGMILMDYGYGFGPKRNVFFAVKGSEKFGGISVAGSNLNIAAMMSPGAFIASALLGFLAWKWLS